MSRSPEYSQAYRAAIKDAVTFLHGEAKRMNDPAAVTVLNTAAFHMGTHFARRAAFDVAATASTPDTLGEQP